MSRPAPNQTRGAAQIRQPPVVTSEATESAQFKPGHSRPQVAGLTCEAGLLLSCAAPAPDPFAIESQLTSNPDWQALLALARRHRVVPVLRRGLQFVCPARVPAEVLDDLNYEYRANAARNLLLTSELMRLLSLFAANAIPVIPFKGPATAVLAYADLTLRQIGDLDLLVRPSDYSRARALLSVARLSETADWGWESSYVDATGHVCVDLHRSITSPAFPVSFNFERLYSRLVPIHGGQMLTLSPEDTLILLCVQVAKDSYTRSCVLNKVCDIAALINSQPDLRWRWIWHEAGRLGCRRIVGLGLRLAHEMLDSTCEAPVVLALRDAPYVDRLAQHVASKMLPMRAAGWQKSLSERQYYFMVRERWSDRITPKINYISKMFRPSDKDRMFMPLPQSLVHLYYLVRPLRVLCDNLAHAWRSLAHRRFRL